jgi:hypothetical protein
MLDKKVEKCGLSRPQVNVTVLSAENKVGHNGSLIHVCSLDRGHTKLEKNALEYCRCECGYQWRKFHNE